MRLAIYAICFLICFSLSCNSGDKELPYTDLLTYGIPLEIQAPDSVDIQSSDIGIQKDVVLKGENGYNIQIFSSDAFKNEATAVEEYLSEIKQHPQFKEIVREEPQGFVYAFQLDSTTLNYGFRYIEVRGGKEIVIQQGMLGIYTKDEVNRLFEYALKSK